MPVSEREFKIGLMVTALLEDKYNKTGHMREEARKAANRYAEKLKSFGKLVHPGFFEYEDEAAKVARALEAEEVDVVVSKKHIETGYAATKTKESTHCCC